MSDNHCGILQSNKPITFSQISLRLVPGSEILNLYGQFMWRTENNAIRTPDVYLAMLMSLKRQQSNIVVNMPYIYILKNTKT